MRYRFYYFGYSAPGELLDLLVAVPYLSPTALVVFHDLALDHQSLFRQFYSINKCLFDSVDGEKHFNVCGDDIDTDMIYGYSDIGGVVIENKDNCIRDLFSVLGLFWAYMPSDRELEIYHQKYSNIYDPKYIELFDLIVKVQKHTWKYHSMEGKQHLIDDFKRKISEKKIYLYGMGKRGKKLNNYIKMIGGNVEGWVVSDGYRTEKQHDGLPVYVLSELLLLKEEKLIIVASIIPDVVENIEKSGIEYDIPNAFIIEQITLYENI